jgi:dTDP-4-amino-4,6-dideoxygalactose transaminase
MSENIQDNLIKQYKEYAPEIDKAIKKVLLSGRYILGTELERFEERFADLVGTKYALGVGNGYDALYISCKLLPYHSWVYIEKELFIASTNAVKNSGHSLSKYYLGSDTLITVISPKNGESKLQHSYIIEDACQSIGMKRKVPKNVFTSCYSFHPLKVLHCYSDGGAIAVNNKALYKDIKQFRNHGRIGKSKRYGLGCNSRLDEIQAAILNVMLDKLKGEI